MVFNSRISISALGNAILQGQELSSWEGARLELWKYIDDNTIIVGNALEHDLGASRIIHPRFVDSGILSRNAVGIRRITWGLQSLCSELLNCDIKKNKGGIHDCLEDVLLRERWCYFVPKTRTHPRIGLKSRKARK
jgi:hypothetical protein